MPNLLRKPFGTRKIHQITPESAGWRYVGFSLYALRAGDTAAEATGGREVILVVVEGKTRIRGAGRDWGTLGERTSSRKRLPIAFAFRTVPSGRPWRRRTPFWLSVPLRARAGMKLAESDRTA